MSLFSKIRQGLVKSRFKRKGLHIIQDIPTAQIKELLAHYVEEGWELGSEYYNEESLMEGGKCTIRRGQSTLLFEWNETIEGAISGPERIVCGIASKHKLTARAFPKTPL
jgi:hypothetical protein